MAKRAPIHTGQVWKHGREGYLVVIRVIDDDLQEVYVTMFDRITYPPVTFTKSELWRSFELFSGKGKISAPARKFRV